MMARLGAAIVAGVAFGLSYPNVGLWPLVFLVVGPLVWAVAGLTWGKRILVALVGGSIAHALQFYWIHTTVVSMAGLPVWAAALITLGFSLLSGLQWSLFAWAAGPVARWTGPGQWWSLAALYVGVEWLFPHLFPHYLASGLYAAPLWIQLADITGPYGISFAAALVSMAALQGVRPTAGIRRWAAPAVGVAALAVVLGYGGWRMASIESTPVRKSLLVGLVQPNFSIDEKRAKGRARVPNYDRAERLTREVYRPDLDLIVWPEGGYPFWMLATPEERAAQSRGALARVTAERFVSLVDELDVPFFTGSLRRPDPKARLRNCALHFDADGELRGLYTKRLLVPFGEYMPFRDYFGDFRLPGVGNMDPGEAPLAFDLDGIWMSPSICYEAVFHEFTRRASLEPERVDAIVNFTNDMWFGITSAPEEHLMVQVMRAVELRMPLIRSTNTGISAFVTATGVITDRGPLHEAATLVGEVEIRDLYSFYREFGDVFLMVLLVLVIGRGVLHRRSDDRSVHE